MKAFFWGVLVGIAAGTLFKQRKSCKRTKHFDVDVFYCNDHL